MTKASNWSLRLARALSGQSGDGGGGAASVLALSVHQTFKISDGGLEAVAQGDLGLPAQDGLGQADIGPALTRVVLG